MKIMSLLSNRISNETNFTFGYMLLTESYAYGSETITFVPNPL